MPHTRAFSSGSGFGVAPWHRFFPGHQSATVECTRAIYPPTHGFRSILPKVSIPTYRYVDRTCSGRKPSPLSMLVPGTLHSDCNRREHTWISHTRTTANAPWPNHTQAVHLVPTLFEVNSCYTVPMVPVRIANIRTLS